MPEIAQRIGFEAAGAIKTLRSLAKAIVSADQALRSLNKTAGRRGGLNAASASLATFDTQAKKASTSTKTLGTVLDTTGKRGAAAGRSLTISWQTFSRVLITQGIVRSLSAITSAISDAGEEVAKFQIRTAEIANITEEGAGSVDALRDSIEELSVTLGRPITEVTEAALEALQNDLGSTAETMDLLRGAANDLALVTGSDLPSAINSISSVLKSYDLDLSEAADITDIFFTSIDKGRIRLSELESRLGTVTPLAATLGIEFADAASAVSALTLSGLNSQTAMTQLRNVLVKLIKPTEGLEEAFERLGVETGFELVQKFGTLQGALSALQGAFNGNERAVAKAFGTIRGSLGVLNLLANEGRNLTGVYEAMTDRAGKAAEGARAIDQVTARNLQREMQTALVTVRGLGAAFNQAKLAALRFFNIQTGSLGKIVDENLQSVLQDLKSRAVQTAKETAAEIQKAGRVERREGGVLLSGEELAEFSELSQVVENLSVQQSKVNTQTEFFRGLIDANTQAVEKFGEKARLAAAPSLLGGASLEALQLVKNTGDALEQVAEQGKTATAAEIEGLRQRIELRRQLLENALKTGVVEAEGDPAALLSRQLDSAEQILKARQAELGLQEKQQNLSQAIEEGEEKKAKAFEDQTKKLQEVDGAAEDAGNEILNIPDPSVDASNAIAQMRALEAAALRAAAAIAAANSTGISVNAYHGGRPVFRAHGGRGQDTQPAMLSRGEFVVNSRSARNFFPQLNAINAGQSPQFRENGGSVTNIGDINITVNAGSGSESPDTGRQIADSLRRELRRKSITL